MRNLLRLTAVVGLVLALVVVAGVSAPAQATTEDVVAQVNQVTPYEPPEFVEVDLPGWAEPFEPLAQLPLWAQAALVSAAIAGLFFVIPIVSRWMWKLGENAERTAEDVSK